MYQDKEVQVYQNLDTTKLYVRFMKKRKKKKQINNDIPNDFKDQSQLFVLRSPVSYIYI